MRLVCPNCDAQYEVDDSAIPAAGRDVQCSACGHGWFQQPGAVPAPAASPQPPALPPPVPQPASPQPAAPPSPAPAASPPAVATPAQAVPPRRPLDENVMAVLREEALREAAARRAEAARLLDNQPDPGQAAAGGRAVPPAAAATAPEGIGARAPAAAGPAPEPTPDPQRAAPRRALLPDIEEINSSLSASSERRDAARGGARQAAGSGSSGGFRLGFLAMLVLCGLLAAGYVAAPRLAAAAPELAPMLESYVAAVDGMRLALAALVERARSALPSPA